ncbi:unnamed protein product [Chironomus riparius]|uniref:Uncharacterized protein n=1 Tax=Chironomus riparius TaxID=315576 RepID=A0A9N9RSL8_9DIPT|nr:unnamed protein product [Chironomus riparius]
MSIISSHSIRAEVMDSKLKILIFAIFNFQIATISSQILSCNYVLIQGVSYGCELTIFNPNGMTNINTINGTHLTGYTDVDVVEIFPTTDSYSPVIPSKICEKFENLLRVLFTSIGINKITKDSFKSCTKIQQLNLDGNNISSIDVDSFAQNSHLQLLILSKNKISNMPENLFSAQQEIHTLNLGTNYIETLPNDIFKPLKNLRNLFMFFNKIKILKTEWFSNLGNLQYLELYLNEIETLPVNVFSDLKNLTYITLSYNKIEIINSESFGYLKELKNVDFAHNQISAFDERFIDNTIVMTLTMNINVCIDKEIYDDSPTREFMRIDLAKCFENFERIMATTTTTAHPTTTSSQQTTRQTTTTTHPTTNEIITTTTEKPLPPGCSNENLTERVCLIEDEHKEFRISFTELREENAKLLKIIDDILKEKESMALRIDDLEKKNENLRTDFEKQNKDVSEMFENIQNQILIMSTRPCSCQ